jgi:hypothetical protein
LARKIHVQLIDDISGEDAQETIRFSEATGREETQKIRNWATENGYNSSPRGRISQATKQAYDAA